MLRTRVAVSLVLLPIFAALVVAGNGYYLAGVALALSLGAWELNRLMKAGGYYPSLSISLLLLGVLLLVEYWSQTWPGGANVLRPGVTLCIILAMYWSLRGYYRGNKMPLANFSLTLANGLYLGWLGAHLLALRSLPAGEWWTLTVLPAVFAADSGAYMVGMRFGRHKLAPWVSPKKTWEGFIGGIVFAAVFTALVGGLWWWRDPCLNIFHGAIIGTLIAIGAPLGDLTVSAFKRQFGAKDTSHLIPGHGGVMDRMDSILVAVVIGYYYILWFT